VVRVSDSGGDGERGERGMYRGDEREREREVEKEKKCSDIKKRSNGYHFFSLFHFLPRTYTRTYLRNLPNALPSSSHPIF
jgi:hypothetical protein